MNSFSVKLILAVTVFGMASFILADLDDSELAIFAVESTTVPPTEPTTPGGCCANPPPTTGEWDPPCTAAGTFASKSYCYPSASNPGGYVYRYDYYRCVNYGGSYLMYRLNCTPAAVPESCTSVYPCS